MPTARGCSASAATSQLLEQRERARHGTKGYGEHQRRPIDSGRRRVALPRREQEPYQVEHDDLFAGIRAGKPINEAEHGAKSTMTAILGRMARTRARRSRGTTRSIPRLVSCRASSHSKRLRPSFQAPTACIAAWYRA